MEDLSVHHAISSYECGEDLMLKPESFMHLCQEMAEMHASLNNLGYEWGQSKRLVWVETQGDYELSRRPRWKEEVRLRTNTGKASPLQARRFVEMTDSAGDIIARADLMWVLIAIDSRRPMPFKRVQLDLADICPPIISSAPPSLTGSEKEAASHFTAPKRDVDFVGHINNASYLIWALETLPADLQPGREPSRFRIDFKHESHAGDAIDILHQLAGSQTRHLISCGAETRADLAISWK